MITLKFIESVVKMPLMKLPVRTTLAHVDGRDIIISPGSQVALEQYDTKLNVTDLVASNFLHASGVAKASAVYPKAKLWGVQGLEKKKNEIGWQAVLNEKNWPYNDSLLAIDIGGIPDINETVFYCPSQNALIVTDLCFNMTDVSGLGPKIILGLFGTYRRFGVSRFFTKHIKDKTSFQKSLGRVLACNFEKIIMSHGNNIEMAGRELLEQAMLERDLRPI